MQQLLEKTKDAKSRGFYENMIAAINKLLKKYGAGESATKSDNNNNNAAINPKPNILLFSPVRIFIEYFS